jgi:hypothetical protein
VTIDAEKMSVEDTAFCYSIVVLTYVQPSLRESRFVGDWDLEEKVVSTFIYEREP